MTRRHGRLPIDIGAVLIAPLGVGIILLAQMIAGIPARTLLQHEAALIVFGGTLGALLLTYGPRDVLRALRAACGTFRVVRRDLDSLGATMTTLAARAHRQGLV